MSLANNIKITTITIGSSIKGLNFNEKSLSENILKKCNQAVKSNKYNYKILSILSNFMEPIYSQEKQTLIDNKLLEEEESCKKKKEVEKRKINYNILLIVEKNKDQENILILN